MWSGRIVIWCFFSIKGVFLVLAFEPVGGEGRAELDLGGGSRGWAEGVWVV